MSKSDLQVTLFSSAFQMVNLKWKAFQAASHVHHVYMLPFAVNKARPVVAIAQMESFGQPG